MANGPFMEYTMYNYSFTQSTQQDSFSLASKNVFWAIDD